MRLGRRHADAVPYLAVGAAVGILVGAAVTIAIVLIVDGAGDEPAPNEAEQQAVARALNSIDACSDLFVRNAPPSAEERRRARQGLRVLNRQYRRTPFGEFKLDESSPDPTTMQEVLKEVIYRTFDGPCPELARGANNELTHEARELDARAL